MMEEQFKTKDCYCLWSTVHFKA